MRRAAVMVLIAGLLGAVPALLLARSPAAARPAPPRVARRLAAVPRPGHPPAVAVPSGACFVAGGCSETPCVQFIGAAAMPALTPPSAITPGRPRATPCARYPDRSGAGATIVPRGRSAPPAPPVAPGRLMPVAPQGLIALADRALARRMAARPRP